MDVVITTAAIRRAMLRSQIVTTNKPTPSFIQAGCPSRRPAKQCQSTEREFHTDQRCTDFMQ